MIGDPCGTSESIYTGKGVFIYKMPAHHSKLVLQMGVLFFLWLCVATLVRCQCDSGGLGGVSNSFLFVLTTLVSFLRRDYLHCSYRYLHFCRECRGERQLCKLRRCCNSYRSSRCCSDTVHWYWNFA